jgi:hypothetical protein
MVETGAKERQLRAITSRPGMMDAGALECSARKMINHRETDNGFLTRRSGEQQYASYEFLKVKADKKNVRFVHIKHGHLGSSKSRTKHASRCYEPEALNHKGLTHSRVAQEPHISVQ